MIFDKNLNQYIYEVTAFPATYSILDAYSISHWLSERFQLP